MRADEPPTPDRICEAAGMATRTCPDCGSQYVASVRRCIDCDAMLVDEVGPEGEAVPTVATPLGEGDQIAYELDGWGNQLRVTLTGMLDLHGIAHVWEVGVLVVAAPHEEAVDELIATVEGGEGDELDDDVPQVAFEIEGLTADELAALDAQLIARPHPPRLGGDRRAAGVRGVGGPGGRAHRGRARRPSEDEDDRTAWPPTRRSTRLYVAVDKLVKDPADHKLVGALHAAAEGLAGVSVPYGMSGNDWDALLAQVAELRGVLVKTADLEALDAANPGDGDGVEDEDEADGAVDETRRPRSRRRHPARTTAAPEHRARAAAQTCRWTTRPAVVDRIGLAKDLVGRLRTRLLDLV